MRLPRIHMSNGAWIFATGVAVAVIASGGVYAAANSIVAVGNSSGTTTAYVTPTRQLQTVTTAPTNLITATAIMNPNECDPVYTPPSGKAIVVTQITYGIGSGTEGTTSVASLGNLGCGHAYDIAGTTHAYEAQSHTFPTGLAIPQASVHNFGNNALQVTLSGYLIPASQLPPESRTAR